MRHAHTESDLVLWSPQEGIVIAGGLVDGDVLDRHRRLADAAGGDRAAGETLAQHWLQGLWLEGRADEQLRRWLLAPMSAPPVRKTGQMRQDLDPAAVLLSCRATVYWLARGISLGIFRGGNPTVTQAIG